MSQSLPWICCKGPLECADCCTIFECDDCGDPANLIIEFSWTETCKTFNGQELALSELTVTYETGGTRTTLYDGGCGEGVVVGHTWSEVTVTINFTARDYASRSSSACYENLSASTWQTTAQVCAAGGGCVDYCNATVGCTGYEIGEVAVRAPAADFYVLSQTRTYTATMVITADECPPQNPGPTDPIAMSCIDDGCADCPRFNLEFNCREIVNASFVDPLASGTYSVEDHFDCGNDVVDEPWTIAIAPWAYTSDCACGNRPTWKRGYFWAIDPVYPPDYPGPGADWTWGEAHVDPYYDLRGTVDAQVPALSIVNCFQPGQFAAKLDFTYEWNCSRPGQGESCPNNDSVYSTISFTGKNEFLFDLGATVTCL